MTSKGKNNNLKAVVPGFTGHEAVENVIKATQDAANQQMKGTINMTTDQIEKTTQHMMKTMEDMASFNRETVETMIQCSTLLAKGAEEMGRIVMSSAQASVENAMTTSKSIMSVKTMRDLVDLQTEYMKSFMDSVLKDGSKITEISSRVTTQVMEPLSARVTAVVERMGKAA